MTTRSVTKAEKRTLEKLLKACTKYQDSLLLKILKSLFLSVFFLLIFANTLPNLLKPYHLQAGLELLMIIVPSLIGGFAWMKLAQKHDGSLQMIKLLKDDLIDGKVEVTEYTSSEAVYVPELDNLYLDVGKHSILYVSDTIRTGNKIISSAQKVRKFPNTRFSIIKAVHSREILDVLCQGTYFEAQSKPFDIPKEAQNIDIFHVSMERATTFPGSLENLGESYYTWYKQVIADHVNQNHDLRSNVS